MISTIKAYYQKQLATTVKKVVASSLAITIFLIPAGCGKPKSKIQQSIQSLQNLASESENLQFTITYDSAAAKRRKCITVKLSRGSGRICASSQAIADIVKMCETTNYCTVIED